MLPLLYGRSLSLLAAALDPMDWPLVCFSFDRSYHVDVSLPFGIRWTASQCQDATNIIAREVNHHGASILNYIDDFQRVAKDRASPRLYFTCLHELLARLSITEAKYKASPCPLKVLHWLGLKFDSLAMTVTLTPDMLTEVITLVLDLVCKHAATLHELRCLLGKLLYVTQVCVPACLFLNCMLQTLCQFPTSGSFTLSPEFQKDLAWFVNYQPTTRECPSSTLRREPQSVCTLMLVRQGVVLSATRMLIMLCFPFHSSYLQPGSLKCCCGPHALGPYHVASHSPSFLHQHSSRVHISGGSRLQSLSTAMC